jgi:hypothetical protein
MRRTFRRFEGYLYNEQTPSLPPSSQFGQVGILGHLRPEGVFRVSYIGIGFSYLMGRRLRCLSHRRIFHSSFAGLRGDLNHLSLSSRKEFYCLAHVILIAATQPHLSLKDGSQALLVSKRYSS